MTRDPLRYPVLAAWPLWHSAELATYRARRIWHVARRRPLVCWVRGCDRLGTEWPFVCARCFLRYSASRDCARPGGTT